MHPSTRREEPELRLDDSSGVDPRLGVCANAALHVGNDNDQQNKMWQNRRSSWRAHLPGRKKKRDVSKAEKSTNASGYNVFALSDRADAKSGAGGHEALPGDGEWVSRELAPLRTAELRLHVQIGSVSEPPSFIGTN